MNIENNNLKKKLTIKIFRNEVNRLFNNKINRLSKSKSLKGFRKGLIPENFVKERFGIEIYKDIINVTLNNSLRNIINTEELNIVGCPILKFISGNKNENLKFIFEFELYSKININFEDIKFKNFILKIKKKDLLKELNSKNFFNIKHSVIKNKIKHNDEVIVDLNCYVNNKKIEKYSFDNINIFLYKKNILINKLKKKLTKINKNKKYFFYVKNEEYKYIKVKIYVKNIKRKKLLFINKIDKNLKDDIKFISKNISINFMKKELLKKHKFSIPSKLLKMGFLYNDIKLELLLNKLKETFIIDNEKISLENNIYTKYLKNNVSIYYRTIIKEEIMNELNTKSIINFISKKIDVENINLTFHKLLKLSKKNV